MVGTGGGGGPLSLGYPIKPGVSHPGGTQDGRTSDIHPSALFSIQRTETLGPRCRVLTGNVSGGPTEPPGRVTVRQEGSTLSTPVSDGTVTTRKRPVERVETGPPGPPVGGRTQSERDGRREETG